MNLHHTIFLLNHNFTSNCSNINMHFEIAKKLVPIYKRFLKVQNKYIVNSSCEVLYNFYVPVHVLL